MKNFIMIALAGLILFSTANAQMNLGVLAGINNSSFKVSEINGTLEGKLSESFGITYDYNIYENFFVEGKVLYNKVNGEGTSLDGPQQILYKSQYLEFPLGLRVEVGEKIRPYIKAGINFSYKLDAEIEFRTNELSFIGDFSERLKDYHFSSLFGAGVQLDFDQFTLFIDGTYTLGFKNILQPGIYEVSAGNISLDSEVDENSSVRINNLNISAGIKLPIQF